MEILENKSPLLPSSSIDSQYSDHKVIGLSELKEINLLRGSIRIKGLKRLEIPEFLTNQISCCEKIFNCCIFSYFFNKQNKIDQIDGRNLDLYYNQKSNLESDYDSHNKQHEDSLRFLYLNTLNGDLSNDLRSEKWKQIGFESNDPRNDFSTGGYFALLFITFCIKQYEEDLQDLIYQYNNISFAVISITLCFYAKLALDYISDEEDSELLRKKHKIKPVSINQFTNYIYNLSNEDNYLYITLAKILLQIKNDILLQDLVINSTMNTKESSTSPYNKTIKEHFDNMFYKELEAFPDYLSSRTSSLES